VRVGWAGNAAVGPLAVVGSPTPRALSTLRPAAFLDRDGVLNEAVPDPVSGACESPLNVADVRLLPGAADAAKELHRAGYALVCVTNQPAAAKGNASLQRLLEVHERVLELLAAEGLQLDATRLCPHHPDGVVDALSFVCECRKPAPGMLLEAAADLDLEPAHSWMLGDTDADIAAGQAAGARAALIEYPPSAHKRLGGANPNLRAPDIGAAVAQLLA
jgi:D-glycero-D-manno-heptose 1,7-bisphosphate phosphatase